MLGVRAQAAGTTERNGTERNGTEQNAPPLPKRWPGLRGKLPTVLAPLRPDATAAPDAPAPRGLSRGVLSVAWSPALGFLLRLQFEPPKRRNCSSHQNEENNDNGCHDSRGVAAWLGRRQRKWWCWGH